MVIFGATRCCSGDVLYSGTGAIAWVDALDQTAAQVGSTPAYLSDSANVKYTIFPSTPGGSSYATVTASASATPGATTLLQIQNYLSVTPAQGQPVRAESPPPESKVSATWGDVAATLKRRPEVAPVVYSTRIPDQLPESQPHRA